MTTREPYICYGFKFDNISYISDTNYIPQDTMETIKQSRVFVVDCLRCKGIFFFFAISKVTPFLLLSNYSSCIALFFGPV